MKKDISLPRNEARMSIRSREDHSKDPNTSYIVRKYTGQGLKSISDFSEVVSTYVRDGLSEKHCTMTDVVTPRFRERLANGEIINNSMAKSELATFYPQPGTFQRYQIDKINGLFYGSYSIGTNILPLGWFHDLLKGTNLPNFSTELEAEVARAVTTAHARSNSSEMQALASAAEGRKTVESIVAISKKVLRLVRAVRKFDLAYLNKQISGKELANSYMEARYAIRPLVIDAQQIIKAYQASKDFKTVRATARGFGKFSWSFTDTIVDTTTNPSYNWTVQRSVNYNIGIRAGVLNECKLNTISVYGLDSPLEAIWEIVPFSFIVDWFFNVGETLASWTPNAGVRELASWVTIDSSRVSVNELVDIKNTSSCSYRDTLTWSGQTFSETERRVERRVNPALSVYPSFKINLDGLKLLDLAIIGRRSAKNLLR